MEPFILRISGTKRVHLNQMEPFLLRISGTQRVHLDLSLVPIKMKSDMEEGPMKDLIKIFDQL